MLYYPTPAWRKTIRRQRRQRRRYILRRILLIGFILFGLTRAAPLPDHALPVQLERVTRPYRFDFWLWEAHTLLDEAARQLDQRLNGQDVTAHTHLVQQFLEREARLTQLEQEIRHVYATSSLPTVEAEPLERSFAALEAAQQETLPDVERVLTQQTEIILAQQGFGWRGQVIPPVAFRLLEPPTFLIISPRERIVRQETILLQPGLSNEHREEIEAVLNARGDIASYVTNIGGLGSYPTMVIRYPYLPYLADVIIHEWAHTYFFTFPTNLAWGYASHPRLRTINETSATLIGRELSRQVIKQYYPEWVDDLPPPPTDQPPEPTPFQLTMRTVRLEVDRLLAAGQVAEAEAFMEAERQALVTQGYNLRKLNQAYFAFHGAYALNPASVDPTGAQLRQLRVESESLKAFLDRVGWLNSAADFEAWLAEHGITTD